MKRDTQVEPAVSAKAVRTWINPIGENPYLAGLVAQQRQQHQYDALRYRDVPPAVSQRRQSARIVDERLAASIRSFQRRCCEVQRAALHPVRLLEVSRSLLVGADDGVLDCRLNTAERIVNEHYDCAPKLIYRHHYRAVDLVGPHEAQGERGEAHEASSVGEGALALAKATAPTDTPESAPSRPVL